LNDPTKEGESSETETINVVPLADLTLVLLVILMVISPMIAQSMIHVAAPAVKSDKVLEEKKEDPDKKPPEPLMISINRDGYKLNNVATADVEELVNAVAARLAEDQERPVLVTADADVTVGAVVQVLDRVKMMEPDIARALGLPEFSIKLSLLKKPEPAAAEAKAKS
jgi:biopolymer transport protein ExbD